MHDHHTHIGQFYDIYYDFHDVFSALKDNGITATTFAYLIPLFEKSEPAIDFYRAMTDEVKDALAFAKEIGLEANALYWVDPMVLFGGMTLEAIMSDAEYKGLAIHPFLNDWNPTEEKNAALLTEVFEFADKHKYDIYFHTGASVRDEPLQFEKWFSDFPNVKVHLAHCKDQSRLSNFFCGIKTWWATRLFVRKILTRRFVPLALENECFSALTFRLRIIGKHVALTIKLPTEKRLRKITGSW